jgi:hypothetical protein
MMKKVVKLTENDLTNIVKRVIEEQLAGGNTNARPGSNKTTIENKTFEIPGTFFKLGSDKVDVNNPFFQKALRMILEAGRGAVISLQGGSSSVGGKKYDNKALADRRAENFKTALINSGVKNTIKILPGIVTPNTDDPKTDVAMAAQFVRMRIENISVKIEDVMAIDNTSRENPIIPINKVKFIKKKTDIQKMKERDLKITYPDGVDVEKMVSSINNLLSKNFGAHSRVFKCGSNSKTIDLPNNGKWTLYNK